MVQVKKEKYDVKLKIFIGAVAKNLIKEGGVAFVSVEQIYIPHGIDCKGISSAEILSFDTLGIYVCEWYDVLRKFDIHETHLKAEFLLNIKTNKKVFRGKDVVDFVDKLGRMKLEDVYKLRDFNI